MKYEIFIFCPINQWSINIDSFSNKAITFKKRIDQIKIIEHR